MAEELDLKLNLDPEPHHPGLSEQTHADVAALAANDYTVYLTNRSNWTVTHFIDQYSNEQQLSAAIGRTCPATADCDTCAKKGLLVPIAGTTCNAASFRFRLRVWHPKGYRGLSDWITINPSCNYRGTWVCGDWPDPA